MLANFSIEASKPFLLVLMFTVAGVATYLTQALNTLIRPISRQLMELHKGDTERLKPRLQNIKERYIALMAHVDNIDTAEFSAGEIERLSLRILGSEITAASAHSWIHQAPGILISLGLLGTFWGLTVGLGKISGALAPGAAPEQTMAALSAIVGPMGTAFQSSLIGLLLSLIVLITSQLLGTRTCLERCESLLSSWLETVLPQELGNKLMSPLKKSIDNLNKTTKALPSDMSASVENAMKEAFAEKLEKMFNINSIIAVEAQQATRQLSTIASNLNESGQDFVMASRVFQQSKFPEALRESITGLLEAKERMTTSSEGLNTQMQQMRDSLLLIQSQWQLLAKSAETELETCQLASQQMNAGLEQLQASSQLLGEGVKATAVVAKQLRETRLEVMRDRKLSIQVAEAVRDRLAVDSSISETCQIFAQSLETALVQWNNNVSQLDSLRHQFIQVAINGRSEDEAKIQDLSEKAQGLIRSINSSLATDLSQAISIQREAINQLGGPMNEVQQITADLIQQLETLKAKQAQESAESRRHFLWGQAGGS